MSIRQGSKIIASMGSMSSSVDLSDYALKTDIPTVPTNVSAFTNDAGYLTEHQDISGKADKSDTYTKSEVDAKVSSVYRFKGSVANYDSLPTTGLVIGDVYNIESNGSNYAWDGNDWDKLSETIDLTPYLTKTEASTTYATITDVNNEIATLEGSISAKADKTEILTKTSQLTNDSGYLTSHQDISGKADTTYVNEQLNLKANQSTTYTKTEVDTLIENIDALPSQTDNAGKVLTTNGTNATWEYTTIVKDITNSTEIGLSQLKINKLTTAEYNTLVENGEVNNNELYIREDEPIYSAVMIDWEE